MNRLRALLSRLQDRFLSRWQHPEPRHTGKAPEPPSEPEAKPEPERPSPAMLTRLDGTPAARVAPYVDKPRHSHRRTK